MPSSSLVEVKVDVGVEVEVEVGVGVWGGQGCGLAYFFGRVGGWLGIWRVS